MNWTNSSEWLCMYPSWDITLTNAWYCHSAVEALSLLLSVRGIAWAWLNKLCGNHSNPRGELKTLSGWSFTASCWVVVEALGHSELEVRPLGEILVGRNGQLFLSLVGEFDLGQAAIRKELAWVKYLQYVYVLSSLHVIALWIYPVQSGCYCNGIILHSWKSGLLTAG